MSESGDQGANGLTSSQVMEQFKLILYPYRATCNVDLLDGDISRLTLPPLALTIN